MATRATVRSNGKRMAVARELTQLAQAAHQRQQEIMAWLLVASVPFIAAILFAMDFLSVTGLVLSASCFAVAGRTAQQYLARFISIAALRWRALGRVLTGSLVISILAVLLYTGHHQSWYWAMTGVVGWVVFDVLCGYVSDVKMLESRNGDHEIEPVAVSDD